MKEKEVTDEAKIVVQGKTTKFYLPDGHWVEIREQNGDDDDILSNPVLAQNAHHLNVFVAGIVVNSDLTPNGKLQPKDVMNMKIRSKYAILFKSRIFSLGDKCEFEYDWGKDNGGIATYEDDLNRYLWDYSKPDTFPHSPLDEGYDKYRIVPYLNGQAAVVQEELTSGKVIRYEYINGHSERFLLELKPEASTKNAELLARNLEEKVKNEWVKVESFRYFSPKDMQEIRESVKINDPNFNPMMDIENPKTGRVIEFPIIAASDFFYPGEI